MEPVGTTQECVIRMMWIGVVRRPEEAGQDANGQGMEQQGNAWDALRMRNRHGAGRNHTGVCHQDDVDRRGQET